MIAAGDGIEEVRCGIATRVSIGKGRAGPIQIHAQVLRQRQDLTPKGVPTGFAPMPDDDAAARLGNDAPPRPAGWRQADLKRAIAAAEQAGLRAYRVEVAPDGTIAIVVGPAEAASGGSS